MSAVTDALADPNYRHLSFRLEYAPDGRYSTFLTTPWYRQVVITDGLLCDYDPQMMHFIEHAPLRVKFTPKNGWAVYEMVARDHQRQLSLWRCVEYWGPCPEEECL